MGLLEFLFGKPKPRGGAESASKRIRPPRLFTSGEWNCHFCQKDLHQGSGVVGVGGALGVSSLGAALSEMGTRKQVCAKCGAVYCLDCGVKWGQQVLGQGDPVCPACDTPRGY